MSIFHIQPQHREEVVSIIRRFLPQSRILAFGSRIQGTAKRYSDLDLCLDDGRPVELSILSKLKEELSNTAIPYRVDLSDWHRIDDAFRAIVLKGGESW